MKHIVLIIGVVLVIYAGLCIAAAMRGVDGEASPRTKPEATDANSLLSVTIPDPVWVFDANYIEPIDIAICGKDFKITLSVNGGKLDIIGDPNHYTEAARIFWCEVVPEALYGIFAADGKAIRRLCESGRVCEVMGHSWQDIRISSETADGLIVPHLLIDRHVVVNMETTRACGVCGKKQARRMTEWQ